MTLRLPLSTPNLTAAIAIREGDGTRVAVDYRGKRVMAASQMAKAVPWIVIAKSDYDEVMRPIDPPLREIALVFGATILVAAFLFWSLWRASRRKRANWR